jgi:cytochrome c-type biogenesis protein CcmH/NrfG
MKNKISSIDELLKSVLILLAFLMPLFFLPTTTEFFQFNKLFLLVGATLIMVILWSVKLISGQKPEVIRSILDVPFLVLIVVAALSTVFSIDKVSSLYGAQGRWFPSLFGFVALIVFYYVTTFSIKQTGIIKAILGALVASTTISSTVSILSYYNMYLGSAPYLRLNNFTLTGSVTTAVIIAAIGITLGLSLLIFGKFIPAKMLLITSIVINFIYLVLANAFAGWFVLGFGALSTLLVIKSERMTQSRVSLMMLSGAIFAIILVTNLPSTRNLVINSTYAKEVILPIRESWFIASSTIQNYPLLATGPSTFRTNFSRYRPLSMNNGTFWDARFDKPYNEFFNTLSTMGLLGLVAVSILAVLIFKLVKTASTINDKEGTIKTLAVAVATTGSLFFVTYATVLDSYLMMLLLALLVGAYAHTESHANIAERITINVTTSGNVRVLHNMGVIKSEYFKYIVGVITLAATGYASYLSYRQYIGEYFMRQALIATQNNDGTGTFSYITKAITANSKRDSYYTRQAQTSLALVPSVTAEQTLSDEDKKNMQTSLVAQAIKSARIATEIVNPLNVTNWEVRASIYRAIAPLSSNGYDWAIGAYNAAIRLDPTNARLRLSLGGTYYEKEDYLSAASQFKQATALKPDYANAHYNLAKALVKLKNYENAKRELETTKQLVAGGSEDAKKVDQEIATLNQIPEVAGAASQKPNVEQIEQKATEKTTSKTPTQEPLSNVGTEEVISSTTSPQP